MKLSDLKVGDKFRWAGESYVYELICIRVRGRDGATEWAYWNDHTGFLLTATNCNVELITEPPEPKYRPFANAEEFKPHRDRWLLENGCTFCRVLRYEDGGLWLASGFFSWYGTLQTLTFDDGTPCGELVSE